MVTRGTAGAGRLGLDHSIDRRTAFEPYIVAVAWLPGIGGLRPGNLADPSRTNAS
jgi:hypothetical protein